MIKIYGIEINEKIIYTVLTLAIGYLLYRVLLYVVNKAFAIRMKRFKVDHRRQKTMNVIINNIIKYTFGIILIFAILGILGVNAAAIVASIGVFGLAIGLAVQDILKDILAGIFILTENQFAIGDVVMIGPFKGEVVFLGLKSTKLRSDTGEIKIVSNRNIIEITNYSLEKSLINLDVDLAYDNDEEVVEKMFIDLTTKISKSSKASVRYLGIQAIGDKITHRINIDTDAKNQETLKGQVLRELKKAIDFAEVRR